MSATHTSPVPCKPASGCNHHTVELCEGELLTYPIRKLGTAGTPGRVESAEHDFATIGAGKVVAIPDTDMVFVTNVPPGVTTTFSLYKGTRWVRALKGSPNSTFSVPQLNFPRRYL